MPDLLDLTISPSRPPRGVPLVTAAFEGEPPQVQGLPNGLASRVRRLTRRAAWSGGRDQIASLAGDPPVTVCGLGARGGFDAQMLASWLNRMVARGLKDVERRLAIAMPDHETTRGATAALAVCRQLALAGYRFEKFRSNSRRDSLDRIHILPPAGEQGSYRQAVRPARTIAEATATARDLANTPPNRASPAWLADWAREMARERGIKARVLAPAEMERRGMGGIVAVGGGSRNPPRLVRLEWGRGRRRVSLVGKGVTFDTGGISLKPAKSMEDMKYDKSGACAVLGIALGAAELDLPFRFRAYIPLAENMPSGDSYRPSDIVRCYNGKTVEVLNTDAEGRMILADALAWAAQEGTETLIELSTLTGASVVALGHHGAALYSPDDGLAAELLESSAASGERLWRMPMWREFADEMRGHHADLRNISRRWGGANCAAAFLAQFVGDLRRWAHLDIAGTAYVGSEDPGSRGATGYGVALVLTWLLRSAGRLPS